METGSGLITIGFIAVIIVFALLAIGLILSRLYRRATKEISFVRTGFGGQKVIMNGGALVFPILHETIPVNMNTLRLEVRRNNEEALITRDRMRVDVKAEFYVRAQPIKESIAAAAQTLGLRTMNPGELKELIEGKFVDALRSVAAEMAMEELHEKRSDFVQKVQQVVTEDLLKNGLELESVSLTGLDQTIIDFFNPNNAFDAEGLTRLTEEIETRKKIRNDIEQDNSVLIAHKNYEAEQQKLEIGRDEEYARLKQAREIAIRRASQEAEIASEQASKEREAEEAKILANRQIDEARIAKERTIETQEIEKKKTVELAEQDRHIAISEKSRAESEAREQADYARAKAIAAEEQVKTAQEVEIANRDKQIELVEAAKNAEREAIRVKVAAEAQRVAAADKAEAVRLGAEGDAEAEKLKAAAAEISYSVKAAGKRAINEAANVLSDVQVSMQTKFKIIENLERIIRESVKPMEKIDNIKIIQVDGLTGNGGGAAPSGGNGGGGNLADQVVNSALRYRAQAPILDGLLKEVGLSSSDIQGLSSLEVDETPEPTKAPKTPQTNSPPKK